MARFSLVALASGPKRSRAAIQCVGLLALTASTLACAEPPRQTAANPVAPSTSSPPPAATATVSSNAPSVVSSTPVALAAPPAQTAEPSTPLTALGSTPTAADVARVARCATAAAKILGWNPLPDGAHHGQMIRTAIEQGGMDEDCAPLASDDNVRSFKHSALVAIDWDWEPKDEPAATTIRFSFGCQDCETVETKIVLPRRWHCFGWVDHERNGSVCRLSRFACEQARRSFRMTTPCELRTGAAWCRGRSRTECFRSPWSCMRAIGKAPCVRAP